MFKQTVVYFLLLTSVNAVLPPGNEDDMWCPPDSCEHSIDTPEGFVGPSSAFQGCYNVTTKSVDRGIWTGALTEIAPPEGWVKNPEPCSSDLYTNTTSAPSFAPTISSSTDYDPSIICMCVFANGTSCCPQEGKEPSAKGDTEVTSDPSFAPISSPNITVQFSSISPSSSPTNAFLYTESTNNTVKSNFTDVVVETKKSCDGDTMLCPETNSCINPFNESCPVEGGETFTGPALFECTGSGRCDASKCTMQNGGLYLTGLSGSQNIPEGCTMTCDKNCSSHRLLISSAKSKAVDFGKYTVIAFGVVLFIL